MKYLKINWNEMKYVKSFENLFTEGCCFQNEPTESFVLKKKSIFTEYVEFFFLFKFLFLFSSKNYNTNVKIKNIKKNFIQQTQNKKFKSKS